MKKHYIFSMLFISCSAFSATQIDLSHQSLNFLQSKTRSEEIKFNEVRRSTDFKQTLHIHLQQTYLNYPVYGGDVILHVPKAGETKQSFQLFLKAPTFLNGHAYHNLKSDLVNTPEQLLKSVQLERVQAYVFARYQNEIGKTVAVKNKKRD